jgi:hypothetical protein
MQQLCRMGDLLTALIVPGGVIADTDGRSGLQEQAERRWRRPVSDRGEAGT